MTSSSAAPSIGDPAPDGTARDAGDRELALSTLWSGSARGLALVFLRHFGCPFCKEHAVGFQTRRHEFQRAGIDVAMIGPGTVDEAAAFRDQLGLSHLVLADHGRDLYRAYALGEASIAQLLHPLVLAGGLRAMRKGFMPKLSRGNGLQLQGQFLIDTSGVIRVAERVARMSDIPSPRAFLAEAAVLDRS